MKTENKVLIRSALEDLRAAIESASEAMEAATDKLKSAAEGNERLASGAAHVASRAKPSVIYSQIVGSFASTARHLGVSADPEKSKKRKKTVLQPEEKIRRVEPAKEEKKEKETK